MGWAGQNSAGSDRPLGLRKSCKKFKGGITYFLWKAGDNVETYTNGRGLNEYWLGLQAYVVSGCVMEEFRLVFASLGALGLIGYFVYIALSEDTFRLP